MNHLETFNQQMESVYKDFWDWFQLHEEELYNSLKKLPLEHKDEWVELLDIKLLAIKKGIYYVFGKTIENINHIELIFTTDGLIENFVFVEELVASAPGLPRWNFTALLPQMEIDELKFEIENISFEASKIHFYDLWNEDYPDLIDLVITHSDYSEDKKELFLEGLISYMDCVLGEKKSVTMVDSFVISHPDDAKKELVPIKKLNDYLLWRKKEFIENYRSPHYEKKERQYIVFQALKDKEPTYIGFINMDIVMNYENKPSYPWLLFIRLEYPGNENGLPLDKDAEAINIIEKELVISLTEEMNNLYLGNEKHNHLSEFFVACSEFKNSSKTAQMLIQKYGTAFRMSYVIYKDKYWKTFDKYKDQMPEDDAFGDMS